MNTTKSHKHGNENHHANGKLDGHVKEVKENYSHSFNEKLNESSREFEKGFGDISTNIIDMYVKQLQQLSSFYSSLFSNPFNGMNTGFSNPFLSSFEKMQKQMTGITPNSFSPFSNHMQASTVNWNDMSKKYRETIESRMDAYKNIFNSLNEAYNSKVNASIEANKKAIEEISKQFNLVTKQSQKFWSDMIEAYQTNLNTENKNAKEPTINESKKRANAAINV